MSFARQLWEEVTGFAQRKREALEILHMAAERIRERAGNDETLEPYLLGMHAAADLIDPEVDL